VSHCLTKNVTGLDRSREAALIHIQQRETSSGRRFFCMRFGNHRLSETTPFSSIYEAYNVVIA
jgi:hypothetical protein